MAKSKYLPHKKQRIMFKHQKENVFLKLFETAEISKFSQKEYQDYEDSLKYYRDLKNVLATAKEEGKVEIAKKMIRKGIDISLISEMTALTEEEINALK